MGNTAGMEGSLRNLEPNDLALVPRFVVELRGLSGLPGSDACLLHRPSSRDTVRGFSSCSASQRVSSLFQMLLNERAEEFLSTERMQNACPSPCGEQAVYYWRTTWCLSPQKGESGGNELQVMIL